MVVKVAAKDFLRTCSRSTVKERRGFRSRKPTSGAQTSLRGALPSSLSRNMAVKARSLDRAAHCRSLGWEVVFRSLTEHRKCALYSRCCRCLQTLLMSCCIALGRRTKACIFTMGTFSANDARYVGGKQARPDGQYSMPVVSPDGRVLGQVGNGNRKDVRNAVEAAHAAAGGWGKRSAHDRSQVGLCCDEVLSLCFCRCVGAFEGVDVVALVLHACILDFVLHCGKPQHSPARVCRACW